MKERDRKVKESVSFYNEKILDIDYKQAEFVYRSIKPYFKGKLAMELGPASGYMTKYLSDDFETLHIVEGSFELINQITDYSNVIKHCSMIEDFNTDLKFDTIIMSHVLEHIENPIDVLAKIKTWLADDGLFIVSVPNAKSIHRIVAVQIGILKTENTLNERDHALGHYRVYDIEMLCKHITEVGFKVIRTGGSFFKPVSNSQIEQYWTPEMVEGFFEAGKKFPENCAEIFAICSK